MWPNPQFPADMVTFTERILNRKPYFLCSDASENMGCFLVRIFRHVNAQKWRFRLKGFLGFFYQIKPSRKTSFFYGDVNIQEYEVEEYEQEYEVFNPYISLCNPYPLAI